MLKFINRSNDQEFLLFCVTRNYTGVLQGDRYHSVEPKKNPVHTNPHCRFL